MRETNSYIILVRDKSSFLTSEIPGRRRDNSVYTRGKRRGSDIGRSQNWVYLAGHRFAMFLFSGC
jgi:hypothetical protein